MYSELSLYYLQQMGIRPWLSKGQEQPASNKNNPLRLLVITPEFSNDQERSLLKQVIFYLESADEDVLITHNEDPNHYSSGAPLIVWYLGCCTNTVSEGASVKHIIHSESLMELLAKPATKKRFFYDLSRVKRELAG